MGRPNVTRSAFAVLIVSLLALAGLGIAALASPTVLTELRQSLSRSESPVTELYFDPARALPTTLKVGKAESLDYVLMNQSKSQRLYTLRIDQDGTVRTIELLLDPGQSARQSVVVVPKARSTRYRVTISVTPTLTIHFSAETGP
jgi:hypothetical protein